MKCRRFACFLVGPTGFEPVTNGLKGRYSPQEIRNGSAHMARAQKERRDAGGTGFARPCFVEQNASAHYAHMRALASLNA